MSETTKTQEKASAIPSDTAEPTSAAKTCAQMANACAAGEVEKVMITAMTKDGRLITVASEGVMASEVFMMTDVAKAQMLQQILPNAQD